MADQDNSRVQVFTADGSFTKSISCSDKPYDVAVNNIGMIHVALCGPDRVEVLSPDGGQPQSTYNANGNLHSPYSIDYGKNHVHVIGPQGELVSSTTGNIYAYGITLDTHGNIYVADNYNRCILKYEA